MAGWPDGSPSLSIAIPTYGRDRVLTDTLRALLEQARGLREFEELFVIDQTPRHDAETERQLAAWNAAGDIHWLRLDQPALTRAMNLGLLSADSDVVLFIDDDIEPLPGLLEGHLRAHREHPDVLAVVGQILQPGEVAEDLAYNPPGGPLFRYLDFPFCGTRGAYVENAMAGNLSVVREPAIAVGGFDEGFEPPVASRFETEFAKRAVAQGHRLWFEPTASIRHLQAPTGGTRSRGSHLNSISPRYGVGDYYFALRRGSGWERLWYLARRPFREVRTGYHLRHPWWIPVKFIGELRALVAALRLARRPPRILSGNERAGGAGG